MPQELHGAALLVMVPTAEAALNRLQAFWARVLLGGPPGFRLATLSAMVVCGWPQSLGSLAWEAAIIALARLYVLPSMHPGTRMLELALNRGRANWVFVVLDFMNRNQIPDITKAGFDESSLGEARTDSAERKSLLRRYRWDVVKPKLPTKDAAALGGKAARVIPTFGVPLAALLPPPGRLPTAWLSAPHPPGMWKYFRCWNLTRLTGRWPCSVLGLLDLPYTLGKCPWCSVQDITVLHPFSSCPSAAERRPSGLHVSAVSGLYHDQSISIQLFGDCRDSVELWQRIAVVGAVLVECITQNFVAPDQCNGPAEAAERLDISEVHSVGLDCVEDPESEGD